MVVLAPALLLHLGQSRCSSLSLLTWKTSRVRLLLGARKASSWLELLCSWAHSLALAAMDSTSTHR